jgi:hypothetical protein
MSEIEQVEQIVHKQQYKLCDDETKFNVWLDEHLEQIREASYLQTSTISKVKNMVNSVSNTQLWLDAHNYHKQSSWDPITKMSYNIIKEKNKRLY